MLERLEGAQGAAERHAGAQVLDDEAQQLLPGAVQLCGEDEATGGTGEDRDPIRPLALGEGVAGDGVIRQRCAGHRRDGAGGVERGDGQERGVADEADPAGFQDEQPVRLLTVDDADGVPRRARRCPVGRGRPRQVGDRQADLAGGDLRLQRPVGSGQPQDRGHRGPRGGDVRTGDGAGGSGHRDEGRERAALLQQAQPVRVLRGQESRQAGRDEACAVVAQHVGGAAALDERVVLLDRTGVAARGGQRGGDGRAEGDRGLGVGRAVRFRQGRGRLCAAHRGTSENGTSTSVRGSRGSPRMRSPITFRSTSEVPPSSEFARDRR